MKHTLTALTALVLTACGGGGSNETFATSTTAACKPTVTVQLFGDSTFYGVNGADTTKVVPVPPPALLQSAMDARYGVGKVLVSATTLSGGTGQQLIDGAGANNTRPLAGIPPADLNVFNYMLNDQANYSPAKYRTVLETFARYAPGVIFETSANKFNGDWQAVMRSVGASYAIPVADLQAYALALGAGLDAYLPDGTHGTQEWYSVSVRDVLTPVVATQVDKVLCR